MGTVDLPKNPQSFAPRTIEAAIAGNMPLQKDLQTALTRLVEEETGSIIRSLEGKLPDDAVKCLDIKTYINRQYQELFNRYAESGGAAPALVTHTAGEIAGLLRSLGSTGKFNTGEIEKSSGKKQSAGDLKIHTNNMLRQTNSPGAFAAADDAVSVTKCVFRDNALKPKTVIDVKLAVNIPASCLISPVFYRYAVSAYLIKFVSRHIIETIEHEMNSSPEKKREENITGIFTEDSSAGFNTAAVRTHIENIHSSGFGRAVHSLAAIFDKTLLDYQFFEYIPEGRTLTIREYEDTAACLPDERFQIRLKYFENNQLAEECKSYDEELKEFEDKIQHLWDLIEVSYQDSKPVFKVNDFEDLAKKNKSRIRDLIKKKTGGPLYDASGENARSGSSVRAQLARMRERIINMHEFLYPAERRLMEDRLTVLEQEHSRLDFAGNPHHIQPGLLIDIDITSIKQKRTTLDAMAAALEEFLHGLRADFQG